jgi:hypothetical protein
MYLIVVVIITTLFCLSQSEYVLQTIAGTGGAAATGGEGVPAISTTLNTPYGLWLDTQENIYFAEFSANKIRKISVSGILSTFVGTGTASASSTAANGDNGPVQSTVFNLKILALAFFHFRQLSQLLRELILFLGIH